MVVSGGCTVRRSDDGGRTFVRLPWTASDARCGEGVVTPEFLANETGYLLLVDGSILRTEDGGRTWSRRTAVPGTRAAGANFGPTDIAFTSPVEGIASTTQGRLFKTTDAAASWTQVREDPGLIEDVHFVTSTVALAVGTQRRAAHRERWSDVGTGWRTDRLSRASAASTRSPAIATTPSGQSLMRTIDGGVTFTSVSPSSTKLLGGRVRCGPTGRSPRATTASPWCPTTPVPPGRRSGRACRRPSRASGRCPRRWCSRSGRTARSRATSDGGRTWSRARRLHLRGRDRRVVRRRLRRLRGRRRRHACCAPRTAVSRGRS